MYKQYINSEYSIFADPQYKYIKLTEKKKKKREREKYNNIKPYHLKKLRKKKNSKHLTLDVIKELDNPLYL